MGSKIWGWLSAALIMSASSSALAFTPEADCDGWETLGIWGGITYTEATAILQEQQADGSWVDVTGSVDSITTTGGGEYELGAMWDIALNGTYRVNLTTLVYDHANLSSDPYVFADSLSTVFECTAPIEHEDRRTPGYWKNHPEEWPVTELKIGENTYPQDCLLAILRSPTRGDARIKLIHHLIAAELNIRNGSDPNVESDYPAEGVVITETISAAHALLFDVEIRCDGGCRGARLSGRAPRGAERGEVVAAKDALDLYNNNGDESCISGGRPFHYRIHRRRVRRFFRHFGRRR